MDIVCDVNTLFSPAGMDGVQGSGDRVQKEKAAKPAVMIVSTPVFCRGASRNS
jgi:hypothetical protein